MWRASATAPGILVAVDRAGSASPTAGSSARSGRTRRQRVVPTPSVWIPRYFASGFDGGEDAEDPDRARDRPGCEISSDAVEIQ
jgi:hypothetical protein